VPVDQLALEVGALRGADLAHPLDGSLIVAIVGLRRS
jgi:hypothetical protein